MKTTLTAASPRNCFPGGLMQQTFFDVQDAIDAAAKLSFEGLIWIKIGNHRRIVGNFDGNGGVWNGEASRIVPATKDDLVYLAKHKG